MTTDQMITEHETGGCNEETNPGYSLFLRIALGISLLVSFVVLLVVLVMTYRGYKMDKEIVAEQMNNLAHLATFNLDAVDYRGLEAIAKLYQRNARIKAVAVEDHFGFPVFGNRADLFSLASEETLSTFRLNDGNGNKIGDLWVVTEVSSEALFTHALLISLAAFVVVFALSVLFLREYFKAFIYPAFRDITTAIDETRRSGKPVAIDPRSDLLLGQLISDFNLMKADLRDTSQRLEQEQSENAQRFSLLAESLLLAGVNVSLFSKDGSMHYDSLELQDDPFLSQCMSRFSVDPRTMLELLAKAGGGGRIVESYPDSLVAGVLYWIEFGELAGRERRFSLRALKFADGDYALICVDLSNVKRLETELRQSEKLRTVATLINSVAHEFNNVLSIVQGRIELLLMRDVVGRHGVSQLRRLLDTLDTASRMSQDLLLFSRTDSSTDLRPVSSSILLSRFRDMTTDANVAMRIKWLLDAPEQTLLLDSGSIQRALLNLVKNALDASEPECIIEIRSRYRPPGEPGEPGEPAGGGWIEISVLDKGTGVRKENRERLFEPFFSTKETGEGTGLGLWTAYRAAEQAGGVLRYTPNKPQGSVFTMVLPVTETGLPSNVPAISACPESFSLVGKSVFLLEDEPELLDILEQFFVLNGCEVATSSTLAQAERIWSADACFDFAICDFHLPDGNSNALVPLVRRLDPDCRVVLVSDTVVGSGGHTEFDLVLTKPLSLGKCLESLHGLLHPSTGASPWAGNGH